MPKLWGETIEAHRRTVREATLDATAEIVARDGLRAVTMARVAEETGVTRATLYKYFPDVGALLVAWHERQVARHLGQLRRLAEQESGAGDRLEAVLEAYAQVHFAHHATELAAPLHRREHVARTQEQLSGFVAELVAEAARTGEARDDVPPVELARYCLHAVAAAAVLPSGAAVRRLVEVTLDGLRPRGADGAPARAEGRQRRELDD